LRTPGLKSILGEMYVQEGVMKFTLVFLLLLLPFTAQAQVPAKPDAMKLDPKLQKAEEEMQMSEEAIAKAKAQDEALARQKAADDAAFERQRQREARIALCIIKPVMTDDEINLCKVAYRE